MKSFRRKLIVMERIFKAGAINFVRNAWLSAAAIAVMVITLTIVLFSVIARATFNNTIAQINDKIDVSVYLKDDVSTQQKDRLVKQASDLKTVKSVTYVSKQEALEKYKKDNQNNADLLVAISQTDNPLPASLKIKPNDPNQLQELKVFLEKPENKALQSDETSYSGDRKEAIDKISNATNFIQKGGLVGIIIFTVISMLIIFNTIRMAIFNRRDELNIMRLLGASTWFIRGPFIVETMLYGLIAAIISVLICNALFSVSSTTFEASSLGLLDIGFANEYFVNHYWIILTAQIAIGIVIGAASSYFATRRYLKFKSTK
ncbi:MAG: Cell division protein FtsX [Patescibacteria group bacterium]|nr:Cell division protein FtsX [Patescibacteria group bacterium]